MSKERMQRGAHIVVVVLEVPGGHGPPSLSPCSDSEVRVLLFNATGDRDTAALLKLLVVRFGGHGGITVPGCLGSLPVLLCCGCRGPRDGADILSVCLPILLSQGVSHLSCSLQGSHSPECGEGTWIIPCPSPVTLLVWGWRQWKSHGWVLRVPVVLIAPVSTALSL